MTSLDVLFLALCITGCTVQIVKLSREYFKYKTLTKISMAFPDQIEPPSLSVCYRLGDIVDGKKAENFVKMSSGLSKNERQAHYYANLTLKQIFEVVPDSKQAIHSCRIRLPKRKIIERYNQSDCNYYFNVRRYYMQEYICYRMDFKVQEPYDFESVSQADTSRGKVYEIMFGMKLFGEAEYLTIIIHRNVLLPISTRLYSPVLHRNFYHNDTYSDEVGFQYTYYITTYERLSSPYDTHCGLNGGQEMNECKKQCYITNSLAKFDKIPFNWIIEESEEERIDFNKHLVKKNDFRDTAFLTEFSRMESRCKEKCRIKSCQQSTFNTILTSISRSPYSDVLTFVVNLPQNVDISTVYVPHMLFNDYVIYIMSCLGTWLGLSVLNLNPLRWRTFRKKRSDLQRLKRHLNDMHVKQLDLSAKYDYVCYRLAMAKL